MVWSSGELIFQITLGTMLQAAGLAMYQTLQGLLASFADKTSAGQVYASATIIDLVGRLSGGIAFANFWQIGLGIPYSWGIGFPYFVAAVSSSLFPFMSHSDQMGEPCGFMIARALC